MRCPAHTTSCSAPVLRFGTLVLAVCAAWTSPLASERQVLTFRTRAWLSFAPSTCRMPLGQASGFSRAGPGGRGTPRFRHRLIRFRHFINGSLALASLHLACRDQVPAFPQRSQPSLLTTAARGGLRPAPDCRPRRALLHLSYSSAPSYSDSAFVTHAPEQTLASAWPGPVLVFDEPGDQHVDERAYLGAQMPAVGIERIDLKFLRSITGQQ